MLFILPLSFINTCWTSQDFKISSQLRPLRRRSAPSPTRCRPDFGLLSSSSDESPPHSRGDVPRLPRPATGRIEGSYKRYSNAISIHFDLWRLIDSFVCWSYQMWRGSRRSVVQVIQPRKSCCNWVVFSSKTEFWFCFMFHFVVVIVCVACCRCNRAFCLE